jgi:hypothetical protein
MPGYFQEARGFSIWGVGRLLWIPYMAADAGALGGAWVSSGFIKRGRPGDRARKAVLLGGALLAMGGAAACKTRAAWLALAIISVALLGHEAWSTNMHLVDVYGYVPPSLSAGAAYITAAAMVILAGRIERIAPPAAASAAGTGGL